MNGTPRWIRDAALEIVSNPSCREDPERAESVIAANWNLHCDAEITRLRDIVAAAADLATGSGAWCHGCQRTLITGRHAESCPIAELEAEAEAYRKELRGH